jgi:hypothetical protein
VFNATFSSISAISWQPVLVVEETEMYARFILDRGHIDNTHVCGNSIICLHVKRQGFHHNK